MFQFLRLSWRDLWRNRRRTILTGLVMTFSVFMLTFFIAMGDGGHEMMIRAVTDSFLGHGQIQHKDYLDDPNLDHRLEASDITQAINGLSNVKGVAATAPRISTGGLISKKLPDPPNPDDPAAWREMVSEGAFLLGIEPDAESKVTTLASSIMKDDPTARCLRGCGATRLEFGADAAPCSTICATAASGFAGEICISATADVCRDACAGSDETCTTRSCAERFADYCEPARFLAPTAPWPDNPWMGEILVGSGLARILDVNVGDRVAISTGTALGRTFGSIYRVAGILRTGSQEINRTFAVTHIDKLSTGLEIPGAATQIVFSADDLDDIDGVGRKAVAALAPLDQVKALTWKQIAPDLDVFMKIDQGSMMVMLILMVLVVAVLLANVVIMAGMERTREYGIRLAMGESPNRITLGLIFENLLLALIAGALGALIGEAFVLYFTYHPIDFGMGEIETAGVVIDTAYPTKFRLYGLVFSVVSVWVLALAGAIFPALRIRKLKPVDAIRFV